MGNGSSNVQKITESNDDHILGQSKKFIKVHLKNGIKDECLSEFGLFLGLCYNQNKEAYFNIDKVFCFNIDDDKRVIDIYFDMTQAEVPYRAKLVFPEKCSEFKRIKRQLIS